MAKKPSSSTRYQRLVAGFAASAFALLGMLSTQQHEANEITASVLRKPAVMTNYRSSGCIARTNKAQRHAAANYHVCLSK